MERHIPDALVHVSEQVETSMRKRKYEFRFLVLSALVGRCWKTFVFLIGKKSGTNLEESMFGASRGRLAYIDVRLLELTGPPNGANIKRDR